MADLAKSELRRSTRSRGSVNRDFLLPSRREIRAPGLEVNAPLVGPNSSRAQALLDILNVGAKAGQQGLDYINEKEAERRDAQRAAGAGADLSGNPDEAQLAKSRAYAQGYYLSGAQRTVIETEARVTQAVQERLNDQNQEPATPEDIQGLINEEFSKVALNEDGTPRNFGDPLAAQAMVNGLAKIRAKLLPPALDTIKEQVWDKFSDNEAFNIINGEGLQELGLKTPEAALKVPKPGDIQEIDPNTALSGAPAAVKSNAKLTTGRLPIQGTITSSYKAHEARGSHGLDIDGYKGQPVEAPAAGKVIQSGHDSRSGNFIIIDHGNGVTSSYSHLDARYFKVGQTIQAGDTLGTVGNTGHVVSATGGDGSHLHYRVKLNGKDVDPAKFAFEGVKAPAGNSSLEPAQVATPITPKALDFEPIMARKPPGMDAKAWKTKMIDALIAHADQANRPDILEGIAMSTRKDGTPSFSPEEILKLNDTADTLRNKHYQEAQRAERELHQANEDKMLEAFTSDNPPSIAQVQEWTQKGLISARFGYTMKNTIESEQHQDEVEARQEARLARQEAESEADDFAISETIRRQSGDTTGADPLDLFNSGKLGSGKAAYRRLAQLRAANKQGADALAQSPEGSAAAQMLEQAFPAKDTSVLAAAGIGASINYSKLRASAYSAWKAAMASGDDPFEAARKVIKEYASAKGVADEESYLKAQQSLLIQKRGK